MTARKAIVNANRLRPNTLDEEKKFGWLYELDGKLAEMFGVDIPEDPFPEDGELLMPVPYDNIYEFYLCAMIDFYNQEGALYQNDMAMFDAAYSEALAWYRRTHEPECTRTWKVM